MKRKDFVKEQVQNLRNDISEQDVMENVKRYAQKREIEYESYGGFENYCMDLYAEIYLETYRE